MSVLAISWYDNKGNQYNVQTLFDPETGKFYDWDGHLGEYVERPQTTKEIE